MKTIIKDIYIATQALSGSATVVLDGGIVQSIVDGGANAPAPSGEPQSVVPGAVPEASSAAGRLARQRDADTLVIDGRGLYLAPGFVDLHVHFRDPGFTEKENIESGSRAAARGGYTTVCCMPNTAPAIDDASAVHYVDERSCAEDLVNVFAVGALTRGQRGEELSDMSSMDATRTACSRLTGHGIAGVSDDGKSLMDENLMTRSVLAAKKLGLLVMDHAEDAALTGGCMNEGAVSLRLGLKGIPSQAEVNIVARDIRIAEETGAPIHVQHVSARESVEMIRAAKAKGIRVTAETAPHYFALTEEIIEQLPEKRRAMAKMNPPLRTEEDRLAIMAGLVDGTIDCIATDHAPHEAELKKLPMQDAPFGIVGLETAFSVSYTTLVLGGYMNLAQLIEKMSAAPALLIGLDRGKLQVGAVADLVIFDLLGRYNVDSVDFVSKGKNTPFDGREVFGRVLLTLHDGEIVYEDGQIL